MKPQVDVILATYNGYNYLPEQLQTILSQQQSVRKIWIRDDLSTDQTPDLLADYAKRYPHQIEIVDSKQRLGIIGNFSALLQRVREQNSYVMLSDQDDHWLPNKVELTLQEMLRLEDEKGQQCPILVHTDAQVVDQDLNLIAPSFWRYSKLSPSKNEPLGSLLTQNVVTGCTVMVNPALLKGLQALPKDVVMHDWWLALYAAAFGLVSGLDAPTILYRQHGKNSLGAKKFGNMAYLQQGLDKLLNPAKFQSAVPRRRQAQAFLQAFTDQLPQDKQKIVQTYASLEHMSALKKRSTMIKHQFYKQGFWRNIAAFVRPEIL